MKDRPAVDVVMSFLYRSSDTVDHDVLPCAALMSSLVTPIVVYPAAAAIL